MTNKQKKVLIRISLTVVFFILLQIVDVKNNLKLMLFMLTYLLIGFDIITEAFEKLKNNQILDENFLMVVATVGALCLSEYTESILVMLLYQIGEMFQDIAVDRSNRNIRSLMDIRPDYANLECENGEIKKVDPSSLMVNTIIVVKPGEIIPMDGIVIYGKSMIDTSALTGESLPKVISVGHEVSSGCINIDGLIKIKVTKEFSQSTASKIINLVNYARDKKTKSENFISKFAKIYTPLVCLGALMIFIIPPVFRVTILGLLPKWNVWIYRALTFLVISCPCALVISIPLSFFAGIGGASKVGILIKGSSYIEMLSKVKHVVFDKTGTITKGIFEVIDVYSDNFKIDKVVEYAALAESFSNHPISKSIKKFYGKDIDESRVSDVKEINGCGLIAKIDDEIVAVGNNKLMDQLKIKYIKCDRVGTIIYVAINKQFIGYILISDIIKTEAKETIRILKKMNMNRIIMLTGDRKEVGQKVADDLEIDKVYSNLLPSEKVKKIENLMKLKNDKYKVAFVGDGINDAPVLSRSDVGVAMGMLGSDIAIEAADVVIMDDDLLKVPKAISISKKCMRIVIENIYFSIGIKIICLALSAFGCLDMWLAIFADVGVMVIAVLNAVRSLNSK